MPARPITFLSDYGSDDEFAGVCRAVIARIAPDAPVIDLTHGIRRHDVAHGAAVLATAAGFAPPGIHLAVVDPGVGSQRRALAVAAAEDERFFVGPDNGLLAPALERFGGAAEAVEISRSAARLEPVSATFHGRDLFAPVAARLALGTPLGELGEQLDPASLAGLELPEPRIEAGVSLASVVGHVDGFGNLILIATPEQAARAGLEPGSALGVRAGGAGAEELRGTYARAFADVDEGALLLYVDSTGSLALAVNRDSASRGLGAGAGDTVELRPR